MGIFSSIKEAIFGKEAKAAEAPAAPASTGGSGGRGGSGKTTAPGMALVDVENRLDSMPGADKLNWRTSIVDLMKLIGVDSSYGNRKELAQEMGREDYSGTAEDNIWLHKRTMQELAANGGKVPAEFLD